MHRYAIVCTKNQMKSIYVNKWNQRVRRNDFGLADGICSIIVQMRSFFNSLDVTIFNILIWIVPVLLGKMWEQNEKVQSTKLH